MKELKFPFPEATGKNDHRSAAVKAQKYPFAEIIHENRVRQNMGQSELGQKVGVSANCVSNWESGRNRPDMNFVPDLCDALGISISGLFGITSRYSDLTHSDQEILKLYHSLNENHRAYFDHMLFGLHELQRKEEARNHFKVLRPVFRNEASAAAGFGTFLDENPNGQTVYLVDNDLAGATDEIIPVSGDSMEPDFSSGDEVLVKHCQSILPGQIGIFVIDGQGYIKEYQPGKLVSHNKQYEDIVFKDCNDIRCYGLVIGKVTKDMIPSAEDIKAFQESGELVP